MCLDPADASISKYIDDLGSSSPLIVEFRFQFCNLYSESPKNCAKSYNFREMRVEFYVSNTAIDFSSKHDYVVRQMKKLDGVLVIPNKS